MYFVAIYIDNIQEVLSDIVINSLKFIAKDIDEDSQNNKLSLPYKTALNETSNRNV